MDKKVVVDVSNVVDNNNNNNYEEINDQIKSNGYCRGVLNIFHVIWSCIGNFCCICVKFCAETDQEGIPKLMRSNCVKRRRNH